MTIVDRFPCSPENGLMVCHKIFLFEKVGGSLFHPNIKILRQWRFLIFLPPKKMLVVEVYFAYDLSTLRPLRHNDQITVWMDFVNLQIRSNVFDKSLLASTSPK